MPQGGLLSRYQVSGLGSQVSGLRYQVSGIRASGLRSQVSGRRSQVSGLSGCWDRLAIVGHCRLLSIGWLAGWLAGGAIEVCLSIA